MPATASLRALLVHSLDYAGIFPPCELPLESAVNNQAQYVRSSDSWMLSTFVLPFAKFDRISTLVSAFDKSHPLRISALGPKVEKGIEFIPALKEAIEKIRSFETQYGPVSSVAQLEMFLPTEVDSSQLNEASASLAGLKIQAFWETPAELAEKTIVLLARAKQPAFGYKLRTGGVTADAFPASPQIATALLAAARNHVPMKFTAGLHHPIRRFREEVNTKMHGFLNVLGAGVLAAEHHWDEGQTIEMLDDEDAGAFSFHDTVFAWRDWEITMDRIKAHRKFVTSFGSCSFDEPREDLHALNLL
jgi:hypothetical protein